ncbi:hypothetical protein D3C81_1294500 [compost metagenome]
MRSASRFISATNASSVPATASAIATAASFPDCTIRPYSRSLTLTGTRGSINIFELLGSTFHALVEIVIIWFRSSFLSWIAVKATYAVISLVSDAGSIRISGSFDASTWLLVASSSNHDLALMVGEGTLWAKAEESDRTVAAMAASNFFIGLCGGCPRGNAGVDLEKLSDYSAAQCC